MMFAIAASVFLILCIQLAILQCPQNCQECSDTNQCLSCKVGHWGVPFNCSNTCSNNCANSNCGDNGYCYACVTGKYGPNCNQECRLCQNEECGLRECTSGCKSGYFQDTIGDFSYCSPCQLNCQRCLNFTYCTLCDVGYYIYKYKLKTEPNMDFARCTTCQSNNLCDQCLQLPNCSQCSYSNGEIACKHCIEGNTLDNQQCVENNLCPSYCLNGCTPDGICHGCSDGRAGYRCDFLCDSTCSKCPRSNQNLCLSCKNGFYTATCDIYCPQNCATRQCDFYNGSCIGGCLPGVWGDKCEDKCSDHCTQSECNRDGTCSLGCTEAYDGLYCNITRMTTKTTLTSPLTSELLPFNTRSQSYSTTIKTTVLSLSSSSEIGASTVCNCQDERSKSFGPMLGGAVTGAVLITALLVGSIAFFLHRRTVSKTSNREQRTDTMYYNTVGRSSVYEDAGQNINKASEMGTTQTPEISVYDQLSRQNTEHEYSGL